MVVWDLLQGGGYGGLGPPGRWLWLFGTPSSEVAMVVWDLMACSLLEPSGTTTIATVKVAMMGHPDHGSVSGGDLKRPANRFDRFSEDASKPC